MQKSIRNKASLIFFRELVTDVFLFNHFDESLLKVSYSVFLLKQWNNILSQGFNIHFLRYRWNSGRRLRRSCKHPFHFILRRRRTRSDALYSTRATDTASSPTM